MRNLVFGTGAFYHVYNRGVDKRKTFMETEDYERFLSMLYRCKFDLNTGEQIVNIHSYACMPNHFHCLLEQIRDNGISEYMQRIGTGYTMMFNRKYNRSGSLFEATYRAKHVDDDAYLTTIAAYIHRNPLDLKGFETVAALDDYRWSSYPHYRGIVQDVLVDDAMLWEYFGGVERVARWHRNTVSDFDSTE